MALLTGGAFAQATVSPTADASVSSVITFEGLPEGAIIDQLSYGNGISGDSVPGHVSVFGLNPAFGRGTNAAMIFDSTCQPGGTPADCSGGDDDLFKPRLGKILIVSEDLDSTDPDDAAGPREDLEFDFSSFGLGNVTIESLDVIDNEENQQPGRARVDVYSGGATGTLLGSVLIGDTGNNGVRTVNIGISGVDFMRVKLNGSGGVNRIRFRPQIEVLYLSDSAGRKDGKSNLYRVELDVANGRANLVPLPNGVVDMNYADSIAVTPGGERLYFADDTPVGPGIQRNTLWYYEFATQSTTEVGVLTWPGNTRLLIIDQAAFSPGGQLYITSSTFDKLFTVNLQTAVLTEVGTVINQATGISPDIWGADIAFTSDGTLYLWTNLERPGGPRGLYRLALPAVNGVVNATFIGGGTDPHSHRGMAVRFNGTGDLVGSTDEDEIHVMNPANSQDVVPPLHLYLNGVIFDAGPGDMATGPFVP
jgi:hypothetical protein